MPCQLRWTPLFRSSQRRKRTDPVKYLYAIAAAAVLFLLAVDNRTPSAQHEAEAVAADVLDAPAQARRALAEEKLEQRK